MVFEWDEAKRLLNLRKHGIDFRDAWIVFSGLTFTVEDQRFAYGEHRFLTLGLLDDTVVLVVHTEQDDLIRLISMREATNGEAQAFFSQVAD